MLPEGRVAGRLEAPLISAAVAAVLAALDRLLLKGAAEFFLEHLAPWKDGTLVVYPTWSPENYYLQRPYGKLNKQCYGAAWDQQLVLNLFTDCIEASTVLERDEAFRRTLQEMIPQLCPQKIGQYGQLQEWPLLVRSADFLYGYPWRRFCQCVHVMHQLVVADMPVTYFPAQNGFRCRDRGIRVSIGREIVGTTARLKVARQK